MARDADLKGRVRALTDRVSSARLLHAASAVLRRLDQGSFILNGVRATSARQPYARTESANTDQCSSAAGLQADVQSLKACQSRRSSSLQEDDPTLSESPQPCLPVSTTMGSEALHELASTPAWPK